MAEEEIPQVASTDTEDSRVPREPVPPIESRFLYVDVSALRAKQLRRGAKPRLQDAEPEHGPRPTKAERIAMAEVRSGMVEWNLPDFKVIFDNR
jgi:DNA-directed RNA polymerase subunit K/omega